MTAPIYYRGPAWWACYAAHVRANQLSIHSSAVKAADEICGDAPATGAIEELADQVRQRDSRIAYLSSKLTRAEQATALHTSELRRALACDDATAEKARAAIKERLAELAGGALLSDDDECARKARLR